MRYFPICNRIGIISMLIIFVAASFSVARAGTCDDCHTSLEKLKKLAPKQVEPPKKLSHGEG